MSRWTKLHIPWRSSRRTSPISARQRTGDPGSGAPPSQGLSAIDGARRSEPHHIDPNLGAISSVQFLPDGEHVIISGDDKTVRQWRVEDSGSQASEVGELVKSEGEMNAAVVSKDGKWIILAGSRGRKVTVWDMATRERVAESIEAHSEQITALDVSPDASKIASGSRDGAVFVWCLETGRRVGGPLKQGKSVLSVRFSPTGDRLASAGPDFSIHVWSIYSDPGLSTTCVPTDRACSLAWSNDGRRLFTGCNSGSILCFDVSGSVPVVTKWAGHPHFDSVSTLRLSNNGKFIISASASECSVKIWDVDTRCELLSLKHASEVLDVEISPDDGRLVSGAKDGKVAIWNLRQGLLASYFYRSLSVCMISSFILTEMSNTAYISWKKAELARAEGLLSSEVARGSNPSHYHLANRALLRVRMQQWDKALDDAQESLHIRSSFAGHLARSVAQIGKEGFNGAIRALDGTLENYGHEERDFFDIIKAIILFDAGHRDAAINHVNGLTAHSPDKSSCAFVQARMYSLLGADAMSTRQYVQAMSFFAKARELCPSSQCPDLDALSLISGWVFDNLRLAIFRQSCEACYAAGCTHEALEIIRKTENIFGDEINVRSTLREWLTDIKSRCATKLESQGDTAMRSKDYNGAIAQYSAALSVTPAASPVTLFVKRSEGWMALSLWQDALKDADEAIKSNPSSPWGYERKHAALHKLKRYGDATEALEIMLTMLEDSPDPEIRQLRGKYINPSDATNAILDSFRIFVHATPFRLIDTTSGRLCDVEKRRTIYTEDPVFQELVSSMTTELHQERIDTVTSRYFQYVMLSHRWEAEELELHDISDKSIYELEASPSATKLQRFCLLARDANVRWAWSDTCCIDKDRDVEFEKSINSMFHWYHRSAATIVYLTGVPPQMIPGALKGSIWMTRGWTLQELLAPPVIRFYYEDWTPYLNNTSFNHKESAAIMQELEDATGVAEHDLLTFRPGPENIRVKLRLASARETTVPVDMAYGLFGIFGVTMPVIHGEQQYNALGRLFQEIIARSGDVACIAWAGRSSKFNSAFPDHIRVYEHASRTIPFIDEEAMEKQITDLRRAWTDEDEAMGIAFYHRLDTLPPASCMNQHLHLPCIVFPLTSFKRDKGAGVRMYRARAKALDDTDIEMDGGSLLKGLGPEDLILVCPWIHELLDTTLPRHDLRRDPTVEAESTSDRDADSESESEQEQGVSQESIHDGNVPSASLAHSERPVRIPSQKDTALKALRLAVRFKQPLGALLLLDQGHGLYRRVATEHDIIIRVQDKVSLDDISLRTLVII